MIRVVICDDQDEQQKVLKSYLENILGDYTNSYEILSYQFWE